MPISLLSFDLDGTLVDTVGEIAQAANLTLADAGLPPATLEQVRRLIGAGAQALMRQLLAPASASAPDDDATGPTAHLLRRFSHHYAQVAGTSAKPYPGCGELLQQLRSAGLQLACVTNKELAFARQVLSATQLEGFFDLLIGGDTLAHKKPHPGVLTHVCQVFGRTAANVVHIGDSRTDVQAARNAGVAAWAVNYGYNGDEPIASARPDQLFDSLPAIGQHVAAMRAAGR